jgi:hypothetical protein
MNSIHSKPKLKNPKNFFCQYCTSGFTRKDNLDRHLSKDCKLIKATIQQATTPTEICLPQLQKLPDVDHINDLVKKAVDNYILKEESIEKKLSTLEKQFVEFQKNPVNVVNNNLQIVCITGNDNYLDMLTEKWDNYDRALEYIKDCALSSLTGDCKLIEKIYLGDSQSIYYIDKSRIKIEYFDENQNKVLDPKGLMLGKKLANNLQNSYLKGVNYLITQNLENNRCPNKFLDDYDLQTWNQHIYDLSDHRYHRKIISHLNIPIGRDAGRPIAT